MCGVVCIGRGVWGGEGEVCGVVRERCVGW